MPFVLDDFLPYRLSVAASRVSRRFARRYGAESGISIPEWRVLAHLAEGGPVSVRDIHARVDMDKSKVSRAAARLEEAGLVRKVAAALGLAEAGQTLATQVQRQLDEAAAIGKGLGHAPRLIHVSATGAGGSPTVAGADSASAQLIALAGGINIGTVAGGRC